MRSLNVRCALILGALCVVSASGVPASAADAGKQAATGARAAALKAHVLSRAELDQLLSQPGRVLLIDVRRPDEISSIGGFPVYLSVQLEDLKSSLAWIPRNRLLVTVSNHAARASRAAELLTRNGFTVAGAAGAELYAKQGGVLTKIAAPAAGQLRGTATRKAALLR